MTRPSRNWPTPPSVPPAPRIPVRAGVYQLLWHVPCFIRHDAPVGAIALEEVDMRRLALLSFCLLVALAALPTHAAAAEPGTVSGSGTLDTGTDIQVRLEQSLSSRTARLEDRFEATVVRPVRAGGRVVIPTGSRVRGIVQAAEPAERPAKSGRLDLGFDSLTVPGGSRMDIRTRVISIKADS